MSTFVSFDPHPALRAFPQGSSRSTDEMSELVLHSRCRKSAMCSTARDDRLLVIVGPAQSTT